MAGPADSVQVYYIRGFLFQFVESLIPFLEVLSSAPSIGTAFAEESTSKFFIGSASSRDVRAWCLLSTHARELDFFLGGLLERIYEYSPSATLHCFLFAEISLPQSLRGFGWMLVEDPSVRLAKLLPDELHEGYCTICLHRLEARSIIHKYLLGVLSACSPQIGSSGPLLIRILFAFYCASNILLEA
jgi:hypothetical protein